MPDLSKGLADGASGAEADRAFESDSANLSVRDMQLLHLIAEGLTTKAIAARLKVNFQTAACRQNQLFQKLHATSRFSAVRSAIRDGMIAT